MLFLTSGDECLTRGIDRTNARRQTGFLGKKIANKREYCSCATIHYQCKTGQSDSFISVEVLSDMLKMCYLESNGNIFF